MSPNENGDTPSEQNGGTPPGPAVRAEQPKRADHADRAETRSRKRSDSPRQDHNRAEDAAGRTAALRLAGLGLELAGSTLAMAGLGYVIDAARGHETPYATIAGTLVGFSLGMYRLIAIAVKTLDEDDA